MQQLDNFLNQASATIAAFAECDIIATSYTDSGTITCLDSEIVATIIYIETPVDGFSYNSSCQILMLTQKALF